MKTRQLRWNPKLGLNPKTSECKSCGSKYTKRNFKKECPSCRRIEYHLIGGKKINKLKQKKL